MVEVCIHRVEEASMAVSRKRRKDGAQRIYGKSKKAK
jgi:hypothetical protein